MKVTMYAKCIFSRGSDLKEGQEYIITEIKRYPKFGEDIFFFLENGLRYASCHFTVTYLK